MSIFLFVTLFAGIGALYLAAAWLDHKHGWQLTRWLNGKAENPFSSGPKKTKPQEQDVEALKERIAVLEKIVTEPAYELNKKINAL